MILEDNQIAKPLIDPSKYRLVRLENGLDAFLISDPLTPKCSAGLSVGVGSMSNELDTLGSAHLLEHLLFLGSKEYPKPNYFEEYLQSHYGLSNAFTEEERTNYYFEVSASGFENSLRIFSRMFTQPLLSIEHMDKEINAVNSENDKNLNSDLWRENQLIKSLGNKTSPYNFFSTGNNNTLRELTPSLLNKKIRDLYEKYYVPSNMKLVLMCKIVNF